MRVVANELEIFELKVVNVFDRRIQFHPGQWPTRAGELLVRLVEMVFVKMQIAERVYKITGGQIHDLRHHQREQRIRRDVERHTEKQICAALIQLATQLAVLRVKLEKYVAWRQRHLVDFSRVPGTHHKSPALRV